MKAALHLRWRRWSWFAQRQFGLAGAAGAVLVLAAAAAALATGALEDRRQALLHDYALRLDAQSRVTSARTDAVDPRDAAWQAIPADAERGAAVARLLRLLEAAPVQASGAQYRLEDGEAGLRRLRVTVPVRGGYAGVRALAARVLEALPHAALDGVDLEREAGSSELNGRLRLSLFFRREGA